MSYIEVETNEKVEAEPLLRKNEEYEKSVLKLVII